MERYEQCRQTVEEGLRQKIDLSREVSDEEVREMIDEMVIHCSRQYALSLKDRQQLGREIAGGEGRPPVDAGARLPAAVADLGNEQGPVLVDPLGGQREARWSRSTDRWPVMMMPTPPRASASRESTQAGVICPLGSERCSLVAERTVLFLDMSGPSSAVSNSE